MCLFISSSTNLEFRKYDFNFLALPYVYSVWVLCMEGLNQAVGLQTVVVASPRCWDLQNNIQTNLIINNTRKKKPNNKYSN